MTIGELLVKVGADPSGLTEMQSALETAGENLSGFARTAEAAGNELDQALSSSLQSTTGQMNLFAQSTSEVASAAEQLSLFDTSGIEAMDTAFGSLDQNIPPATEALHEVKPAADEARDSLEELGQNLLKVGEAFAVFEGLKEFASDAVEAFGEIEKASISLTALTGSADTAEQTIASMQKLANSDALSFPALVTAAQRMTAFGFSTEQMNTALQAASNAAAATSRSIEDTTAALDRMALTGNAGGRQLAALGISLENLGSALGTTADQASAAFKALDQAGRLDALATALQKYAGVATQAAQGISGQLTIFGNQVRSLMEEIGAAIAPLLSDLLKFASTDIVPAIKALVDAFNELPAPVKEAAIAVGGLGLAIPTVSLALSGLSSGLAALSSGLAPLATLGTAISNVAFAVTNGLVPALTVGETALLTLGTAVAGLAAAFVGLKIGEWADANIPAFAQLTTAINNFLIAIPGVQNLINYFAGVTSAEDSLAKNTQQLNDKLALLGQEVVQGAGESIDSFAARVRAAAAAISSTGDATTKVSTYMQNYQKAIVAVIDDSQVLHDKVNDAKLALDAANATYAEGAISAGELAAKQDAYNQALYAMDPAARAAATAAKNFADQIASLQKEVDSVSTEGFSALSLNADDAATALDHVTSTLNKVLDAMQQTTNPKTLAGLQALVNGLADLQKQLQQVVSDQALTQLGNQLTDLQGKYPQAFAQLNQITQNWATNTVAAAQQVGSAFDKLSDKQVLADYEASLKGVDESATKLANDFNVSSGKMQQDTLKEITVTKSWYDVTNQVGKGYGDLEAITKKYHLENLSDLNNEIADLQKQIALLEQYGAPQQVILASQEKLLADQIKLGEETGATADQVLAWSEKLTDVQTKMGILHDQSAALSDLYTSMIKDISADWDQFGKDLGDSVASLSDFGKAFSNLWDNLKKQIAELVTQYLLKMLKDAILENTNLLQDFNKAFNFLFGGGGTVSAGLKTAQDATEEYSQVSVQYFGQAGQAVKQFGDTAKSSMSSAAASVQASASEMASGLGLVAEVVGAIAGIFSAIELAHTNTLLSRIEESTRYVKIWTGEQSQNLLWCAQKTVENLGYVNTSLDDIKGHIWTITDTLKSILQVVSLGGGGSGGGGAAGEAAVLAALETQIKNTLANFDSEIMGPYGLGPAVQGFAESAGDLTGSTADLSSSFQDLTSSTTDLAATVTAATQTTTAAVNTMVSAVQQIQAPAAVVPGPSSTITPYLAPKPAAGTPAGPGGSNAILPNVAPTPAAGGAPVTVQVTVTGNQIGSTQVANHLADQVMQNVVNKLRTHAGLKL